MTSPFECSDHAYLDVNKLSGTEQGSGLQESVCVLIDKTQVLIVSRKRQ